jgi:fumarylacetoacetase
VTAAADGFGLDHLPYGVVRIAGRPTPAVRIGDRALDLRRCAAAGLLPGGRWAEGTDLGGLLAAGPALWAEVRAAVRALLEAGTAPDDALVDLEVVGAPLLPVAVGDLVDFSASIHHSTAVGRLFRPDGDPLVPAWRHLPVGYHGRSGTVVVSGTDVVRPVGQLPPAEPGGPPAVGPTAQLDLELEVAIVAGGPATALGSTLTIAEAAERAFGVVLMNDWSARDIQSWEYRPLGPFLGKSFATSIAGWVTPLAALAAARVPAPPQDPPPPANLRGADRWALDLSLEVVIVPAGGRGEQVVSRVSFADMYWTIPQLLAHVTSNGAVLRPGDLFGSGTVSGPEAGSEGCLLERTLGGTRPFAVAGVQRTYLEDGDRVVLRGHCAGVDGGRITLAAVEGTVLPARPT